MPARKPTTLNTRNDTKADRSARAAAEGSMTPRTELARVPPAMLKSHKVAAATWKRVVGLYNEIEGKIATSFDEDLLVKYCLLEEEVIQLAGLRDAILKDFSTQVKEARKFKPKADQIKDYVQMWSVVNALFARFQGMDARLDGKRKLLHALSQSLYLTPRSRAGVEPPMKEPEQPKSEMDKLLGE